MKKIINFLHSKKEENFLYRRIFIFLEDFQEFLIKYVPTRIFITYKFRKAFGKELNLDNPKALNEKLQWKKIYIRDKVETLCADKYLVREWVSKRVGKDKLVPLFYQTKVPNKIPFEVLNFPCVIKSNHGSGQNIILKNKEEMDKKKIIATCNKWLRKNYYGVSKEWQYKEIPPRIIVEKLLLDSEKKIPEDYKFHCFNGKVNFIQVDTDRFGNHKRSFFDKKWNLLPFTWCPQKNSIPAYKINKNIKRPKNLDKMVKIAEDLSKCFDYVRVDLYDLKKKIYFGELTFGHGSGFEGFFPKKWDKFWGGKLILGVKNERKK